MQLLQALQFTHKSNIAHRDIKLQNIIVGDRSVVKLIDYGFSIASEDEHKISVFCGTPSYMSPEVVKR